MHINQILQRNESKGKRNKCREIRKGKKGDSRRDFSKFCSLKTPGKLGISKKIKLTKNSLSGSS